MNRFIFLLLSQLVITTAYAEFIPTPHCSNGHWVPAPLHDWTLVQTGTCQSNSDLQPAISVSYSHPVRGPLTMLVQFTDKNNHIISEVSHVTFPWGAQWIGGRHSTSAKCGPTDISQCPVLTIDS